MRNIHLCLAAWVALATAASTLGSSNQAYGPLKLPYDLGGGCLLSQDLLAAYFLSTNLGGGASRGFPRVTDPRLKGAIVYFQWACEDKGSTNPLGYTTSAGMRVTIQ